MRLAMIHCISFISFRDTHINKSEHEVLRKAELSSANSSYSGLLAPGLRLLVFGNQSQTFLKAPFDSLNGSDASVPPAINS